MLDEKILITGGAGFIGYHLAKKLLLDGYKITLADNLSRGIFDTSLIELLKNENINFINIDLMDKEQYKKLNNDYKYIYHLAAIIGVKNVLNRPYDVIKNNMDILFNMIDFAKTQDKLEKFIFTSTSEVYAGTLQYFDIEIPTPEYTPLTVTDISHPRTSYMLSKIYGEAAIKHSGIPFMIIRPHNFYGPRMGMAHVIPELLGKAYKLNDGDKLDVFSVEHKRTFCHINDAVNIITELVHNNNTVGETFNIGNETPEVTMMELAQNIISVVGKSLTINPLPPTPGSPKRRCPSMDKTSKYCSYKSNISLITGISNTFSWYQQHVFNGNDECAK